MDFFVNVDLVIEAETEEEAKKRIEDFFGSVTDDVGLIEIFEVTKV